MEEHPETLIVPSYALPRASDALRKARVESRELGSGRLAALADCRQSERLELGQVSRRSPPMPAPSSIPSVRLRSTSATAREAAAWTMGMSSSGTRKRVRRIASRRSTVGASYISARSPPARSRRSEPMPGGSSRPHPSSAGPSSTAWHRPATSLCMPAPAGGARRAARGVPRRRCAASSSARTVHGVRVHR